MPIELDGKIVRIRSKFYQRDVDIANGPSCHAVFSKAPETLYFLGSHHKNSWGIPFEAAVKVNGQWHQVGPHKQKSSLWPNGSVFSVNSVKITEGKYGPLVEVVCRPPESYPAQIEVSIYYEISEKHPFFRKSIKVRNISGAPLTIENLCPEIFYGVRLDSDIVVVHDFRNEVCDVHQDYQGLSWYKFPADIDVKLKPGEEISSFNMYQIFTPNSDEERAIWKNRALRQLAPDGGLDSISFQCSNLTAQNNISGPEQFMKIIDQCASLGIETIGAFVDQFWTNIGDYEVRTDLFPKGEDDIKRIVDYAHKRGLKISTYCSYSIAWHGSSIREKHLDWECIGENGLRFDPGAFGNMCFLSGWGDYIREKLMYLVDGLGFDRLDIDGPTSIPCYDITHNHSGLGNYEYLNWLWEKKLFADFNKKGVKLKVPRGFNYIMMGAAMIPGGYVEEDFSHSSGMEQLLLYRRRLYQARYTTPAWAVWGFTSLGEYHGNSIKMSEDQPYLLDHALGALFGYGNSLFLTGDKLYCGVKTEEIFKKWIGFFKNYRETLGGDFNHLLSPDGTHIDAVMHTQPKAKVPAVAVVFNPSDKSQEILLPVNLRNAGFEANSLVLINSREKMKLDDNQFLAVPLRLNPFEIKILEFSVLSK